MRKGVLLRIDWWNVEFFIRHIEESNRRKKNRRHLPDALGPDVLVQSGVDAHVLGAHFLLGELADLLDGAGGALLVANAVDQLGQMDCAFAGDHLVDGRLVTLLLLGLGHCRWFVGSCKNMGGTHTKTISNTLQANSRLFSHS